MPFAFGHLIGAWILIKLYEYISSKKITRLEWAVYMFGAILPDIDYLVEWIFNTPFHRYLTHTLAFAIFIGIITFLLFKIIKEILITKKKFRTLKATTYGLLMTLGIFVHLSLDMIYSPGIILFWPYNAWYSFYGLSFMSYNTVANMTLNLADYINMMILDMGLGVLWIGVLYWYGKLRF